MHPYDGDPNRYPRSVGLPDDGDAANALTLNTPYEALSDRTAWARQRIVRTQGLNWPYRMTPPIEVTATPIYDAFYQRWVIAGGSGGSPQVYWSQEYGVSWIPTPAIEGNTDMIVAIGAHPTTGRLVAVTLGNRAFYCDGLDGAWADGGSHIGIGAQIQRIHYHAASGLFIAVGHASDAKAHVITSPDGKAWTLRDAQIPAAHANAQYWRTAASPTRVLALSGSSSAPMVSNDGITWTPINPFPAGRVVAVGYGDGEFLVAMLEGALHASVDAVTWTLRGTVAGQSLWDLVAVESAWLAFAESGQHEAQLRCSADGGVTWRLAGVTLPFGPIDEFFRLGSSGSQGMGTNGAIIVTSQNVG